MPVPTTDLSGNNFTLELSRAQLGEVWGAESDAEGAALLARIAQIEDIEEEPRKAIWVDFMYQQLAFAKEQSLIASKALAFFDVMLKTHAHAVGTPLRPPPRAQPPAAARPTALLCCPTAESMAKKDGAVVGSESEGLGRDDGFRFFADQLLAATKALPVPDRFTLLEAQVLPQHKTREKKREGNTRPCTAFHLPRPLPCNRRYRSTRSQPTCRTSSYTSLCSRSGTSRLVRVPSWWRRSSAALQLCSSAALLCSSAARPLRTDPSGSG